MPKTNEYIRKSQKTFITKLEETANFQQLTIYGYKVMNRIYTVSKLKPLLLKAVYKIKKE